MKILLLFKGWAAQANGVEAAWILGRKLASMGSAKEGEKLL